MFGRILNTPVEEKWTFQSLTKFNFLDENNDRGTGTFFLFFVVFSNIKEVF